MSLTYDRIETILHPQASQNPMNLIKYVMYLSSGLEYGIIHITFPDGKETASSITDGYFHFQMLRNEPELNNFKGKISYPANNDPTIVFSVQRIQQNNIASIYENYTFNNGDLTVTLNFQPYDIATNPQYRITDLAGSELKPYQTSPNFTGINVNNAYLEVKDDYSDTFTYKYKVSQSESVGIVANIMKSNSLNFIKKNNDIFGNFTNK